MSILEAVKQDRAGKVAATVKNLNRPNKTYGECKRTLLGEAAYRGSQGVTKWLLNCKQVDNNYHFSGGFTAFMVAAYQGNNTIVNMFLDRNDINVNAQSEAGRTALIHAVKANNYTTAQSILGHDTVDVAVTDYAGKIALHYALIAPYNITVIKKLAQKTPTIPTNLIERTKKALRAKDKLAGNQGLIAASQI